MMYCSNSAKSSDSQNVPTATVSDSLARTSSTPKSVSVSEGKEKAASNDGLLYPHPYPPLNEKEIEEQFRSGSGPGGQKINKKQNCVIIRHIPTGIVVKCQEGRDLHANRHIARSRLQERLDVHYNGDAAWVNKQAAVEAGLQRLAHNRSKKRLAKKLAFKDREGLL